MMTNTKDLPGARFVSPFRGLMVWRCMTCHSEFAINGMPRFCPMCDAMLGLKPDDPEAFNLGRPHAVPKVNDQRGERT